MSAKKAGLGRSFDSLVPTEFFDESFDPTLNQDDAVSDMRNVKLAEITADPDQPRRHFDEVSLDELAASIKEHGVLQPIILVTTKNGYMIVAGERRYRASIKAGLDKIPALVRTLSDQHRLELSLIENIQRRDLNVLETAVAYTKLRDQFSLTLEEISARVGGKSVSDVSNTMRLLKLPDVVKNALMTGEIQAGQARPLIGCSDALIDDTLPRIIGEGWSSRSIERFIASHKAAKLPRKTAQKPKLPVLAVYQEASQRMAQRLQADVRVNAASGKAGKLIVSFKNRQEFDRIRRLLGDDE